MEYKEIYACFSRLAKNKRKKQSVDQALEKHEALVQALYEHINIKRDLLRQAAFGELEPQAENDHMAAVREAIRDNDTEAIRQAGLNALAACHYTALRLAAEFDHDIAALIDFESTFGELASVNQRMFIDAALAPPGERVRV